MHDFAPFLYLFSCICKKIFVPLQQICAHVHVGRKDTKNLAKIWLEPMVQVAKEGDLTEAQLKQLLKIAEENQEMLLKQWVAFKNGGKVKLIKINK